MRLLCKLLGCATGDYLNHGSTCVRCGSDIYDYTFVQREGAWLAPWYSLTWFLYSRRRWFFHKCENENCFHHLVFTDACCCSDKCYEEWVPF